METSIELVGKIGSMALIDQKHHELDYNKFARLCRQLRPGTVWVSSGATEIGRLDYVRRCGSELSGAPDEVKTDYAAQGQAILMKTYRDFIDARYSVRQVLVEHQHFNDEDKKSHIRDMLLRAPGQNAVPIINYNDAVSSEENRKMEIKNLIKARGRAVELVDNDETAAQIACLVMAKRLLILTNLEGIYEKLSDPGTLIREISADSPERLLEKIDAVKKLCSGSSRSGAGGAAAKLEYIKPCLTRGTEVFIASSEYDIEEILSGSAPGTHICVKKEE